VPAGTTTRRTVPVVTTEGVAELLQEATTSAIMVTNTPNEMIVRRVRVFMLC